MTKLDVQCSWCKTQISITNTRYYRSKSRLFFCSKNHMHLAKMSGKTEFDLLVPNHYYTLGQNINLKIEQKPSRAKQRNSCIRCGKSVRRNQNIYCSVSCINRERAEKIILDWKENSSSGVTADFSLRASIRRYILDKFGWKCCKCGWSEHAPNGTIPLEIDHIDGNWKNSSEDNLRVLCPNCHACTSNYKVYNIGKNEQSRYSYWKERGWQ